MRPKCTSSGAPGALHAAQVQAILGLEEGGRWGAAKGDPEAHDTPYPLAFTPGKEPCGWITQMGAPRTLCAQPPTV